MDYNINFKYKSGGGTAGSGMGAVGGMRSKAIQASTKQGVTGTTRPDDSAKKLIDTNIKLSTNILKLNQSVTMLTATIKNRGLGNPSSPSSPSSPGNDKKGYSFMGIAGAASLGGISGFLISKIGQIGDAYMQRASMQRGSSGIGGFKTSGVGNYMANDISAMNKAYRMASGDFSNINDLVPLKRRGLSDEEQKEFMDLASSSFKTREGVLSGNGRDYMKETPEERRLKDRQEAIKNSPFKDESKRQNKIRLAKLSELKGSMVNDTSNLTKYGTVFGIDSNELGAQAGNIRRGGGDINKIIGMGMGMGQKQEMPGFMTYLSSTMEEAITAGMSNWSKPEELASDLAGYIALSDNKSAKFATGMLNKSKNSQVQASKGKIDSYDGLNTWFASQDVLMDNFKTKEGKEKYLAEALNSNKISQEQYQKGLTLKDGASYYDLTQTIGHSAATYLTEEIAADPANVSKVLGAKMGRIKGTWGDTVEGMQQYSHINNAMGGALTNAEIRLAYKDPSKANISTSKGISNLDAEYEDWNSNGGGMEASRARMRDRTALAQGEIADAALKMETALYKLATTASNTAIEGIKALGDATSGLAERLNSEIKGNPKVETK